MAVNRDEWAALGRAAVTLIAGAALWYAIGRYLGWWVAAVLFATAFGYGAWWVWRLGARMRW
jgi:hypothetical protein